MVNQIQRNRAKNVLARKKVHNEKEPDIILGVPFLCLRDEECRWPTSDTGFCGAQKDNRRVPYCAKHMRKGYVIHPTLGKANSKLRLSYSM